MIVVVVQSGGTLAIPVQVFFILTIANCARWEAWVELFEELLEEPRRPVVAGYYSVQSLLEDLTEVPSTADAGRGRRVVRRPLSSNPAPWRARRDFRELSGARIRLE